MNQLEGGGGVLKSQCPYFRLLKNNARPTFGRCQIMAISHNTYFTIE
jgi:hypothetical protein